MAMNKEKIKQFFFVFDNRRKIIIYALCRIKSWRFK